MTDGYRLLVVDDDSRVLWFLGEAIRSFGLDPECVGSPLEAFKRAEAEPFDGIVLDWQMPGMSGTELARKIRRTSFNGQTPIVLLTAFPSRDAVQESLAAGVNFFLPKPVSVEQLRNLLDPNSGFLDHERRRSERAPVQMSVDCNWQEGATAGRAVNLSSDGAQLALAEAPPMNSWVSLVFRAAGESQPVELTGQVTRVTLLAETARAGLSREVGVRFVGLPVETADWLNRAGRSLVQSAANQAAAGI